MNKKFLIIASIIVILLVGASGFWVWTKSKKLKKTAVEPTTTESSLSSTPTSSSSSSDLTGLDPNSLNESINKNLSLAQTRAQGDWQSDAALSYTTYKISASLKPEEVTETYVFGSINDPGHWWTFSALHGSDKFVRALIPKDDYLGADIKPLKIQFWKTNFAKAFQAAEAAGGAEWRQDKTLAAVTVNLLVGAPQDDWLWWTIEYTTTNGESKTFRVNPFTGLAVGDDGEPLVAVSTTPSSTPSFSSEPSSSATPAVEIPAATETAPVEKESTSPEETPTDEDLF